MRYNDTSRWRSSLGSSTQHKCAGLHYRKEAYAVLATLQHMHWLAATPADFELYTDPNNLIYLFDPLSIVPEMSQTTHRKVLRWAVRLIA